MQICTFTIRSLNLFHYFRTKTQEHGVKVTESGQGERGMQGRYSRPGVMANRCDGQSARRDGQSARRDGQSARCDGQPGVTYCNDC